MRRALPFLAVAGLFAIGLGRDLADLWIDATVLPPLALETGAEVRDRQGDLLRAYTVEDGLWRLDLAGAQVDAGYLRMLMAYEDKRFRSHAGVDPLAMLRAAGQAALNGGIVSGGSTLTMQVARLLEDGPTGRWGGKLRQIRVALALERQLGKDRILSLYLHLAPYGGNVEGLRAGSLMWFGKEPARLTPAQAALLVALPQSPEARRPDRNPATARDARDRVLDRMVAAGVLSAEAGAAARTEPVPSTRRDFPVRAAHLADRVRAEEPLALRHDLTIDGAAQAALEELARSELARRDPSLSIAILAADRRTGEVLASVGSAGYTDAGGRQGFVDMTRAVRSPGSTLKPLVYAMAFDQGLAHPETVIDDRPVAYGRYAPQNFDGLFRGEVRVADALRLSLNIPVIMLTDELGPERLMASMRRAGMAPDLPGGQPGLAVALGGVGVTLEDMVRLYAGLANGGVAPGLRYRPGPADTGRVVSRSAAWQVGHVLAGLIPPDGVPNNHIAWKTGTSYGHRDTWAIGWDGGHVVGVWIGRPDGTPVPGAFGAEIAAPVLFKAFQRLKPATEPLGPPPPETLLLPTARLPQPLQRFRGRTAAFEAPSDAPKLAFPPDGAVLPLSGGRLAVKLRDGVPPFTLLANGLPLATGVRQREIWLDLGGVGFSELSVIDGQGRSDRVRVELR